MWPPSFCLWLALALLVGVASGQSSNHGNFEDADKSNEYTDQQFDLRHTIPGEPGLDYPILSAPPKTSFVCRGRHEGYYADVESRCQAFRICAHTARSPQGFGFLCPNGTLFSQKHFVCDWYRNVNCDESERFYDMNEEKTVGSTHEMMERVRHMMEYPMKTITKALQQVQTQSQNPHRSLRKDLSGDGAALSEPAAVQPVVSQESPLEVGRGEALKSEPLIPTKTAADDEGIYVNSLGELSSDPGIQFDHTNAHIIAEYPREYHYQKQKNFAERVNAGLEEFTDALSTSGENLAPDYMKHIRNTKDEAVQIDLVSNINNLLDEVSTDVDPSVSGYQSMAPPKVKQPFRFLSRGFAMQAEKGSPNGYGYKKPKLTPSTVRFTPNEIPTEDHKSIDHQKHKLSKTTSTTTETIEPLLIAPTLPPVEGDEVTVPETTEAPFTATTVPEPLTLLAPPELAVSGEVPAIESIGQAAALTASLPISEDIVTAEPSPNPSPESVEKTDVHNEAAKLLLAGVQLTSHDEERAFLTNQLVENSIPSSIPSTTTTTTTTTTSTSTTASPTLLASTETVTEINSFQERIKGYRRNRPAGMLKRANIRPLPVVRASSTTTTTQRSTAPTKSYLERLAASRLRLSRLSQATKSTSKATTTAPFAITTPATTTTVSSLSQVRGGAEPGPNKKLAVRDIDRETKVAPTPAGKASWESVHNNLQRFQVQRGNRVYTPATRSTVSLVSTTTSPTTPRSYNVAPSSRPTASASRGKSRYSNFKTQAPVQRTRGTTTPRSITTSTFSPSTTSSLASLNQHISALASNYNNGFSYNQAPQISKPIQQSHVFATHTTGGLVAPVQPQTHTQSQTTSNISPSSAFLSFDKLTRAIVDESVLQNFKSAQSQQQQHRQQQHATRQVVKQQPPAVSSSPYVKPAAAPAISSLTVPPRPQQQQQPQLSLPTPPGIVIARAEGQRIAPNSVGSIVSNLATQAPVRSGQQGNSYVSLNDFLNNKFGQQSSSASSNIAPAATLQQQQRVPHQQHQQQYQQAIQHQQRIVQKQPVQQQPQLSYISQQYQQPQQQHQTIYQQYQQPQKVQQQQFQQQQRPTIHSIQQPYLTPNIFVPYQQQQQQLPQFPPLAPPVAVSTGNIAQGPVIAGRHVDHLNVQLPTLGNGLIPGLQLAQKRSDVSAGQLQLVDTNRAGSSKSRERAFYAGRTSYDVPQSSVGRLPNDVTQTLRRRLRRY
ncbi:nuclear factor of activated T-cells 5 [Drosophila bipectinata]|uniref:nuclear factor of activated T-cells 5 n=1 Tax=Drosophila bipectinata TaxID=42026 RepID=UPI001C89AB5C|nr:serine-rich adhesin for platelets [Drosophila bipectinata]